MIVLSDDLRQARAEVLAAALESGTLTFYTGPQPASGVAITTQTELASYGLPATITAVDATIILSLSTITIGVEGTVVWGRITNPADEWVMDGDAGSIVGSAAFRFNTVAFGLGGLLVPPTVMWVEA
jgi:hypothetical protein